jgi:uncharacterized protein YndB with AHSA1/START domain
VTAMRLDRWFAPPVEVLWRHLTEAELLDRWLVHGRVDAVPGGRVEMTVADEPGNAFDGSVRLVEAPVLLEHTLGGEDSVIRWELNRHGQGTRMALHQYGEGDMAWPAAGWHVLLDALDAALEGAERAWTWPELTEHRRALGEAVMGSLHEGHVIDSAITVSAPPSAVFAALITPALVDQWLPSAASIEPRVGGRYDLGWTGPRPTEIVELQPDRVLAYRWTAGQGPETTVRWRLAAQPGGTRVRLAHRGWDDGGGWREALEDLKKFAEERKS